MKHLAAYLLLTLGGNESPSAKDIKGVLESVGVDADDDRLKQLLEELKGKNIQELITEGQSKLASVPSGGGGGGGGAAPAAGGGGGGGDAGDAGGKDDKKEEKDEEESDDDMGFGLFD